MSKELEKQFERETKIKHPTADNYSDVALWENAKHLYYAKYSEWLESLLTSEQPEKTCGNCSNWSWYSTRDKFYEWGSCSKRDLDTPENHTCLAWQPSPPNPNNKQEERYYNPNPSDGCDNNKCTYHWKGDCIQNHGCSFEPKDNSNPQC